MMLSIHDKYPWIKDLAEKLKQERIANMTPDEAVNYAIKQKKPVPELESKILSDPIASFKYAFGVIKGAWPEAESLFKGNARFATYYSMHVLKAPWPDGEAAISNDSYYRLKYGKWILVCQKTNNCSNK